MSVDADGLSALRAHAIASSEDLISLLGVARTLGLDVPSDDEIRDPLARLGDFDVAGLSDDAHRLTSVYRAVAEQLHRLPEQQIRLDDVWSGMSGRAAMAQVVAHQRRAEAELGVLRTLSEATVAASSGIDRLLRTWYVTVARCASPFISGVPLLDLPAAILTGRVPLPLVAADVASRVTLFRETAETTMTSVQEILHALNRATEDLDSHDRDGRSASGSQPSSPSSPSPTPAGTPQPPHPPTHDPEEAPSPPETRGSEQGVDVPFTLSHGAIDDAGEQPPARDETAGAERQIPLPAQPTPPAQQPTPPAQQPTPPAQRAPEPASREPEPPPVDSAAPGPGLADSDLALAGDQ